MYDPVTSAASKKMDHPQQKSLSKSSSYLNYGGTLSHNHQRLLRNHRENQRDRSVDSLVVSKPNSASKSTTNRIRNSSTDGCLSSLAEDKRRINDVEPDVEQTSITPEAVQGQPLPHRRPLPQLSSLDSLLESNEAEESNTAKAENSIQNLKNMKSNSLPKTAFGSLQLRVAKIKAQLDTLKSDGNLVGGLLKTPTAPYPNESTLHPNTPSCGYEFSMPPNLTNGDESPLSSSSPNRQSPFTTTTTTSSSSSLVGGGPRGIPPPFLPLTTTTTTGSSTLSSSPSTLSPASSNSLPSISRPQNLKLPQSYSLNTFPASAAASVSVNNREAMMSLMEAEELNRLSFFFDVMSTQEMIAKVLMNIYFLDSRAKRV